MKIQTRLVLLFLGAIIVIYIPFTLLTSYAFQTKSDLFTRQAPGGIVLNSKQTVPIDIRDIVQQPDGKLDIVLSVNVEKLVSFIYGDSNNGEATKNPLPTNISFVMHNHRICDGKSNLTWVFYVHTAPANKARRMLIRNTWGNKNVFRDQSTALVFMVGTPQDPGDQRIIKEEQKEFGDMVQGNFVESYKNLTLKGIMGLKWVSEHCRQAKYALKADDDAFINIFALMKSVNAQKSKERFISCPVWPDNSMAILRDPAKCMKWCVKYDEFPGKKFFPKYCAGLAFVLSSDILTDLYEAAKRTPFFWIDDVYLTGLLPPKAGNIEYVNLMQHFTLKQDVAMKEYDANNTRVYMSHIKDEKIFYKMWHATLRTLPEQTKMTISKAVFEKAKSNLIVAKP